jgi:hypothetical protein
MKPADQAASRGNTGQYTDFARYAANACATAYRLRRYTYALYQ